MESSLFVQMLVRRRQLGELLFIQLARLLEVGYRGIDLRYSLLPRLLQIRLREMNIEDIAGLTQVLNPMEVRGMSSGRIGENTRRPACEQQPAEYD